MEIIIESAGTKSRISSLSPKPLINLFSVGNHDDPDFFVRIFYLIKDSVISNTKFIGIYGSKFFRAVDSRVLFKLSEMGYDLIAYFWREAIKLLDDRFSEDDLIRHHFFGERRVGERRER